MVSEKQRIYIELLQVILPHIRNNLSGYVVFGKAKVETFELSQLIHDIYLVIDKKEFIDHDFWFLNVHAKSFYLASNDSVTCVKVISLIKKLISCVPEGQRKLLEWDGPK